MKKMIISTVGAVLIMSSSLVSTQARAQNETCTCGKPLVCPPEKLVCSNCSNPSADCTCTNETK